MVQDGMTRYDLEIPRAGLGAFKMLVTAIAGTKRFLYTIKYICSETSIHKKHPTRGNSVLKARDVSNGAGVSKAGGGGSPMMPIGHLCGHFQPLETLPATTAHSTSSTKRAHDGQVRTASFCTPNANLEAQNDSPLCQIQCRVLIQAQRCLCLPLCFLCLSPIVTLDIQSPSVAGLPASTTLSLFL